MRERKKTGVHGTLEMIPLAWKFNSKQLLSKTLNSKMNIIEARAVLILSKKSENVLQTGGLGIYPKVFFAHYPTFWLILSHLTVTLNCNTHFKFGDSSWHLLNLI